MDRLLVFTSFFRASLQAARKEERVVPKAVAAGLHHPPHLPLDWYSRF
ncbi:MAG: hypothetical protein J5I94_18840 [Phaeodactylibacter sp.]|nr:hypothetical protein [Phaeodactylibacter sp.]